MPRNLWTAFLTTSLALSACGDKEGDGQTGTTANTTTTATDSGTDSTSDSTTTGETTDPTSGTGTTSTTTSGTGTDTEGSFVTPPDGGNVNECDPWAQDCPEGEKCMPWANDGGNSWNATKCSPVAENPDVVGDVCTVEGSGVSGVDSCELGSMCYYVNPETNEGICVAFCEGSEASPICDTGYVCTITNNGVLTLCRPKCDPILQDCEGDTACLPAGQSENFTCIIDASGDAGVFGDPCEYTNSCDPGLFCASAEGVPNCQGSSGCCTHFCDLTAQDPNTQCMGTADGVECVPWYEEGTAPPEYEHVGACVIPQ